MIWLNSIAAIFSGFCAGVFIAGGSYFLFVSMVLFAIANLMCLCHHYRINKED